jgi:hypothetical protein
VHTQCRRRRRRGRTRRRHHSRHRRRHRRRRRRRRRRRPRERTGTRRRGYTAGDEARGAGVSGGGQAGNGRRGAGVGCGAPGLHPLRLRALRGAKRARTWPFWKSKHCPRLRPPPPPLPPNPPAGKLVRSTVMPPVTCSARSLPRRSSYILTNSTWAPASSALPSRMFEKWQNRSSPPETARAEGGVKRRAEARRRRVQRCVRIAPCPPGSSARGTRNLHVACRGARAAAAAVRPPHRATPDTYPELLCNAPGQCWVPGRAPMERTVCGLDEAEPAVGGPARDLARVPLLLSPLGRLHRTPFHLHSRQRPRRDRTLRRRAEGRAFSALPMRKDPRDRFL